MDTQQQDNMGEQTNSGTTDLSIGQLLSEFKSTLSRQNINFKGKLTITLGETSGVDIKFQPHQTLSTGGVNHPQSSSSIHLKGNEQRLVMPHANVRSSLLYQQSHNPPLSEYAVSQPDSALGWLSKDVPVTLLTDPQADHPPGSTLLYSHLPLIGPTSTNVCSSHNFGSSSSSIGLHDRNGEATSCLTKAPASQIEQFPTISPSSTLSSLPPFEKIVEQRFPLLMSNYSQSETMTFQDITSTFLFNPSNSSTSQSETNQFQHTLDRENPPLDEPESQNMENFLQVQTMSPVTKNLLSSSQREMDVVNNEPPLTKLSYIEAKSVVDVSPLPKEDDNSTVLEMSEEHSTLSRSRVLEETLFATAESREKPLPIPPQKKSVTVQDLKNGKVSAEDLKSIAHDDLVTLLLQVMENYQSSEACKKKGSEQGRLGERESFPGSPKQDKDKSNEGATQVPDVPTAIEREKRPPEALARPKRKTYKPVRVGQGEQTDSECNSVISVPIATQTDEKIKKGNRRVKKKTSCISEKKAKPEEIDSATQPLKKRNRLRSVLKTEEVKDGNEAVMCEEQTNSNSNSDVTEKIQAVNLATRLPKSKKLALKGSPQKEKCFTCKECFQTFSNKLIYRQHLRTHSTGYQCDICGKTLKTKDSLYHHHRGLHAKDKPYQCRECNASFNFHHSYKLHLQRHKGERPHKCNICHKTYLTSNHLKVHTEAAHGIGSKICGICGKTFSYSSSLKLHLYTHSEIKPHSCDKCGKGFSTKQSLRVHRLTHEVSRNFPCGICGKFYKSEHSMNMHYDRHKNRVKKFMCDICGKVFLFKSTLKAHAAIHSKARPHTCPVCGKSFKSKASLYTHKYVHRDTYPFLCGICGKSFKSKNCCAAHMKRHENNEKHICQTCGSSFPDKGGLSKHMKTVHLPKKHFTCTICGKKGTRADNMRTHVKSHRAELSDNVNPMDFILEESVCDTTNSQTQAIVVRSRARSSGVKNNRKLFPKGKSKDNIEHISDENAREIVSAPKNMACVKNEQSIQETLQPNLLIAPSSDQQQYSTQTYILSHNLGYQQHTQTSHTTDMAQFQPALTHQPQHLIGPDKMPSYLTYLCQHDVTSDGHGSGTVALGPPMSSLLSAMTPVPDSDTTGTTQISVSGYNSNALQSFHNPISDAHHNQSNHRVIGSVYSDNIPMPTGLSQIHQAAHRTSTMHDSILIEHDHSVTQLQDVKNPVQFHGGSLTQGAVESRH